MSEQPPPFRYQLPAPTHGNCRFFLAGECRRYPPQVISQAIMGGPIMSVYPRVKADGGACGEWKG